MKKTSCFSGARSARPLGRLAVAAGLATCAALPGTSGAFASVRSHPVRTGSRVVALLAATARKRVTSPRVAIKSSGAVGPLETVVQTLNNCGPSSVVAALAYWHVYRSEAQVASVLRADNSDWGMSPVDLPAYARSVGLRALVGYGGSETLVKDLIANGFPVIASQYVSSADQVRHYRPIESYSDRDHLFVSADPYLGAGHAISYSEFNAIWAESDYRFQVIYPVSRQSLLNAVLRRAGWSGQRTYSGAIAWEERQMRTSDFASVGSWIWYNGYADVAFDQAQLGRLRQARATLTLARRQGISPVLIAWVQNAIAMGGSTS